MICLGAPQVFGQNEHFEWLGLDSEPQPADSIDAVPYSGELNDFSGGYDIGDTVGDFHLWSLEGEEFLLSNEVDPEKPTIIFNGSSTCVRFQNDWDPFLSPQVVEWTTQHLDDFNWIPVYVAEAHALDVENCPTNCPAFPIPGPNGLYFNQHRIVQDRIDAAQVVMDWMGPSANNAWSFPFDDMLIDSPDNLIYTHFFMRPAGIVIFNCDGIVIDRGDWLGTYLSNESNRQALEAILENPLVSETGCLLAANSSSICEEDSPDTDGDGTCDAAELELGTDPFNPCDLGEEGLEDVDGDGACNALEIFMGTDPNNPCEPYNTDTDNDGYCDIEEELLGSNPNNPCSPATTDTDGDGFCDSEEVALGSDLNDPCSPDVQDSDMDGLCDSAEIANGSDPNSTCDPFGNDADGDGLCDQLELIIGSSVNDPCDPYAQDTDGDGYCDQLEALESWDALDACSPNDLDLDGDGWCAGTEMASGWSDTDPCTPIGVDSDGDGLCDMEELLMGSDAEDACSPLSTDTDGDGVCDQQEIVDGTSPTDAASVLSVGTLQGQGAAFHAVQGGFNASCAACLGEEWHLLDPSGRVVQSARLNAWNPWNVPMGVYILRIPTADFQGRVLVQD
ncbi:MAG: hypothetical protein ISP55_05485 [Flavobacteriales bacterium]|nr:hypothetical protein [Flavobacteriales bacterium]